MGQQIPLPLKNFDRYDFDAFIPGENTQLIQHLRQTATCAADKNIYLWGEAGTGKSHLLQAVCTTAGELNRKIAYIPLSEISKLTTAMLDNLEHLDLVCVDDFQYIAGDNEWELAFFNLFNRLRDAGKALLLSANKSSRQIPVSLPDLKSRLSWDLVYHLKPLSSDHQAQLFQLHAANRGFKLSPEVTEYIIKRIPRDTHSAIKLIELLDSSSLVEKRKITIPFVRQLLEAEFQIRDNG